MLINLLKFIFLIIIFAAINCENINLESGFKTVYSTYKQCENEAEMLMCLKLKAVKLVDRALSIQNIPIVDGISLTKKEDSQRSLDDTAVTPIDENDFPSDSEEKKNKLNSLLWDRIKQFFETRSLQLKMNKLFTDDNSETDNIGDGRKKDKNKGMYIYMMMMKGGMMALAYKGLALLAGKALLVSKIALTLALIVAIKKLFSGGHHSQKTTYEIVKTPVITHSHQYAGASSQNGHYAADYGTYEGGPYARSLDNPEEVNRRMSFKSDTQIPSRYVTHIIETVEGRSLSDLSRQRYGKSLSDSSTVTESNFQKFNIPYAHVVAYRNQLKPINVQAKTLMTENIQTSTLP